MSNSMFYRENIERRFNVPLLAMEVYANRHKGEDTTEALAALLEGVMEYCGVYEPDEEDFKYFIRRLMEREDVETDTPEEPSSEPSEEVPELSFGTSYHKFISKIDLDQLLLIMTNYNVDLARQLFCKVDKSDTLKMVRYFLRSISETQRVQYESCLYGFGGGYSKEKSLKGQKNDSGGEVTVLDVTTKEGTAALRSCGFGVIN